MTQRVWSWLTSSPAAANEAPWRFKLQSSIGLFISLIVTGVGILLIYVDFHDSAELRTYQSAGSCTGPASALTTESCRYTGPATVTASARDPVVIIDVTFARLPSRTFATKFSDRDEPTAAAVAVGATSTAELWGGHLTRFAGVTTFDNPEKYPMNFGWSSWIVLMWGLILTAVCATYVRRAWRR